MLSALAKYIFGGIMDNAEEESMECETREVNDWLLINMPDQALDDMDFDSEDERSTESEDEVEEIPLNEETDEDDILTSLPLLLAQDKPVCDTLCPTTVPCFKRSLDLAMRVAVQSTLLDECLENFQVIPESLYVNHSLYYPSDYSLVLALKNLRERVIRNREILREQLVQELTRIMRRKTPSIDSSKQNVQPIIIPQIPQLKLTVVPAKEAMRMQIKQLKTPQRAVQRDVRKMNSRSYLNRQNKSYIYESSVKTNRRSNLQRHHSGANNNRKCC